jgi:hypothetical protein
MAEYTPREMIAMLRDMRGGVTIYSEDGHRNLGSAYGVAADVIECLLQTRSSIVEECAKVAETEAEGFLSPEYASNQPLGSLCERFACQHVANAIRVLALPNGERDRG